MNTVSTAGREWPETQSSSWYKQPKAARPSASCSNRAAWQLKTYEWCVVPPAGTHLSGLWQGQTQPLALVDGRLHMLVCPYRKWRCACPVSIPRSVGNNCNAERRLYNTLLMSDITVNGVTQRLSTLIRSPWVGHDGKICPYVCVDNNVFIWILNFLINGADVRWSQLSSDLMLPAVSDQRRSGGLQPTL